MVSRVLFSFFAFMVDQVAAQVTDLKVQKPAKSTSLLPFFLSFFLSFFLAVLSLLPFFLTFFLFVLLFFLFVYAVVTKLSKRSANCQ